MWRLRIVPISNWLIIMAIVFSAVMSLGDTVPAQGVISPPSTEVPTPDAACGTWKVKTVQVMHSIPGGAQGFVASARYNGCTVERRYIDCDGGHTTIYAVSEKKCFWHRVSATRIHAAYNYTVCSTPIKNVGYCWGEYMRLQFTASGAISYFGSGSWPSIVVY